MRAVVVEAHLGFCAPAAAAAASLQSCLTLCDPIDGSPPGSAVLGILQARTLEWVAISFSNAWKWKVKVKSLSPVRPSATPWTAAFHVEGTNCILLRTWNCGHQEAKCLCRGGWLLFLEIKWLSDQALVGALSLNGHWSYWMIQDPADSMASERLAFSGMNSVLSWAGHSTALGLCPKSVKWRVWTDDPCSVETTRVSSFKVGTENKGTLLGRATGSNGTGSLWLIITEGLWEYLSHLSNEDIFLF